MNLGDFNSNFTVRVVQFDNTTTNNISVNFKVQCISNIRVSIHTTIVDTTQLSEGYTDIDVVNAAWENVKTIVNAWASFNITEERLSELLITSTSSVIDVSTFNTHFSVKVVYFKLIPNINPTFWSIQFSVSKKIKENISAVFEGLVPLTQDYCNNSLCSNIAAAGWELVKEQACNWALNNIPTDSIVDTVFIPINI